LSADAGALDASFPCLLRGNCCAYWRMGHICESFATIEIEMDHRYCRDRWIGDPGIRQYSLLLLQILRRSGDFEDRALQSCAKTVRGADRPKPIHGFTWGSVPSGSRGAVTVSLRRRDNTLSCGGAGIR